MDPTFQPNCFQRFCRRRALRELLAFPHLALNSLQPHWFCTEAKTLKIALKVKVVDSSLMLNRVGFEYKQVKHDKVQGPNRGQVPINDKDFRVIPLKLLNRKSQRHHPKIMLARPKNLIVIDEEDRKKKENNEKQRVLPKEKGKGLGSK